MTKIAIKILRGNAVTLNELGGSLGFSNFCSVRLPKIKKIG